MNTNLKNCPQVPGGSRGEADGSRRRPLRARGEKNLRARVLNCATTVLHTDNEMRNGDHNVTNMYNTVDNHNDQACLTDSDKDKASSTNAGTIGILTTTEDVVQETSVSNPVPAEVVKRARKKWTQEMNIFILRTYFTLTALETDTKSYLTELYNKFIERFPDMEVSKQRIGDQRRAIIRSKYLTAEKINEIRTEVETTLNNSPNQNIALSQNLTQNVNGTQRMRWRNELNETIMRNYYRITELETNKSGYRQPLHKAVIEQHPDISHVSEQRIAGQRRVPNSKQ